MHDVFDKNDDLNNLLCSLFYSVFRFEHHDYKNYNFNDDDFDQ